MKYNEEHLPQWVRMMLAELRRQVSVQADEISRLLEELSGVVQDDADTQLELPESGTYRSLGNGVTIQFADLCDVHYEDDDRTLVIESGTGMVVIPVLPTVIKVRRR